jgi:radical SAM superfamily enzyme
MEKNICQSCSMPLDEVDMRGTEKDGSASKEYCKYCYQKGEFVTPVMTLQEMSEAVKTQMEKRNIPQNTISLALRTLPYLKRWHQQAATEKNLNYANIY